MSCAEVPKRAQAAGKAVSDGDSIAPRMRELIAKTVRTSVSREKRVYSSLHTRSNQPLRTHDG